MPLWLQVCVGQSLDDRRVRTVHVLEGERLNQLTHHDQHGNESFTFWDTDITAARAMKYDSLGRLIEEANAHCNVGCWIETHRYTTSSKRTFITEFRRERKRFPREEAYAAVIRKVLDVDALEALPEMVAVRRTKPRLTAEEHLDSLGRVVKRISYEKDGKVGTIDYYYDHQGQLTREVSHSSDGDTSAVDYQYGAPCKEAVLEHHVSNRTQYWKFGKAGKESVVLRTCDPQGSTVRSVMLDVGKGMVDTIRINEYRYSSGNKLIMELSNEYGPLIPQRSYDHDERGNEVRFVAYSPGGPVRLTRSYRYNEYNEVLEETVSEFGHTVLLKYRYEYW